jgi:hypothetical protein
VECDGLNVISEALKNSNDTLVSLNVCSNSAKDEGLIAIAQSLYSNTSLMELYIWGNAWTTPTCDVFRGLLEVNRLQKVDVDFYEVDGVNYLARTM